MGMYDSITMVDAMAELVTCAHDHPHRGELQTKDLECDLTSLYVHGGRLYARPRHDEVGAERVEFGTDGDHLVMSTHLRMSTRAHTGVVLAYAHCDACEPIVYERDSSFGERVDVAHPWTEWELTFERGVLVNVTRVVAETREELRAKTAGALPDDDRIARRVIERNRAEKQR